MGAYSPSRLFSEKLEKKIIEKIIKPTLFGLKDLGITYKGFLYAGLMIKNNEPYLIEYNVRMGDPECQTILPKLDSDLLDIFLKCCDGNLKETKISWNNKKSLSIVLCSNGYPDEYKKNILDEESLIVTIEAGETSNWKKYLRANGISFGIDRFGESAPFKEIFNSLNLSEDKIVSEIQNRLRSQ